MWAKDKYCFVDLTQKIHENKKIKKNSQFDWNLNKKLKLWKLSRLLFKGRFEIQVDWSLFLTVKNAETQKSGFFQFANNFSFPFSAFTLKKNIYKM